MAGDILLGGTVRPGGPFPIVEDTDQKGGFRVVADHATRDAILAADKKIGMFVVTQNDNKVWQLTAISPDAWAEFTGSGSSFTVVTNTAAGLVPQLAAIGGAVTVDNGDNTVGNRRLTFDDIDQAFGITSFDRSGFSGSAKELGDTIASPAFVATYNATLIAPLTINDGTNTDTITLLAQAAFGYANGGGSALPARSYMKSGINQTVTWTLSAKKSPSGPVKTATLTNQWQAREFYDITTVPGGYNETFIEGLASNRLSAGFSGSYSFGAGAVNKKIYMAWPTAHGNPSSIKDQNGFIFPMTKVATAVPLTNAFAVIVSGGYDVWESDNFITATFTLTVT